MEREDGRVFGCYLHGLFDNDALTDMLIQRLAKKKVPDSGGCQEEGQKSRWEYRENKYAETSKEYRERQYDKLADLVRNSLDMAKIYEILAESES